MGWSSKYTCGMTDANLTSRWIPLGAAMTMQQAFAPTANAPINDVFVPSDLANAIRKHLMEE